MASTDRRTEPTVRVSIRTTTTARAAARARPVTSAMTIWVVTPDARSSPAAASAAAAAAWASLSAA